MDLSAVPASQRQLFTVALNPSRGVLVFLLAVNSCSGVSVSDLCAAPLDQPQERQNQLENYVSTFLLATPPNAKPELPAPPVVGCGIGFF